jgi:TrmH family RNA methyltransferase
MIRSRQNKTLKDMRRLRRSKGEQALLEGPHLIGEAIAADIELGTVLATPEFMASAAGATLGRLLATAPTLIEADLLESVSDADAPRGVVAVASLPRPTVAALPRRAGTYLYLDGLQDPGNLGALVRVAEAAGAVAVALSPGCAHPNHPRALRASAGSLLRMPVALEVGPDALARHLAGLHPDWLVLVPRGGESLFSAALDGASILVVGAEGPGLSAALLARATRHLTIPMAAPVESLNATVAAALALFEIRRRRFAAPTEP